jgi:proteasome assembly chaperone (PAC2) family protein
MSNIKIGEVLDTIEYKFNSECSIEQFENEIKFVKELLEKLTEMKKNDKSFEIKITADNIRFSN